MMKFFKSVLNFYINSSMHVALAVCAMTWVTLFQFQIEEGCYILYFVFFATITGYNFVKYFGIAKFHHRGLAKWLKVIQVFSILSFVIMCYVLFHFKLKTIVFISVLGLITFLYAIPLMPKAYFIDSHKNLREIGGLKIYVIAFVWTFTTVFLPVVDNEMVLNLEVLLTAVQRFVFVMVLMLPFEIRDLNYDSLKLATIPQKIGVKKTKRNGVLLLVVFLILEFLKEPWLLSSIFNTFFMVLLTLLLLVYSNKAQSKYYSAFWVESLPIVWFVILLMFG